MLPPIDHAYAVFALTLALLFWTALVLLLLASRRGNHWLRRFGLMMVVGNAALFWTAACVGRLLHWNMALTLNNWSRVSYAMLAFYVLGYAWLHWRVGRRG